MKALQDVQKPGVELSRIILVNWYGHAKLDVEVRGNIALIGRNGSGKSSLIDAIQLVLSGGNRRHFKPNASAEVTSGASRRDERRSVLDYCVGKIENHVLRKESVTYVALVFRNAETQEVWTAGMGMSARDGDADVTDLGSFIAKDFDLTTDDFVRDGRTRPYAEFEDAVRKARGGSKAVFLRGRPGEFSSKLLRELTGDPHLDHETYLKALKNSLAFKAMEDPTDFVRSYVLPLPGLSSSKVEGLRKSFANWKAIEERIRKAAQERSQVVELSERLAALIEKRRESWRWGMVEVLADERAASELESSALLRAGEADRAVDAANGRMEHSKAALSQIDGSIAIAKADLGEQKLRDELSSKESEADRADAEAADAEGRRVRIAQGLMGVASLRPLLAEEAGVLAAGPLLAAIESFSRAAAEGDSIERALKPLLAAVDGVAERAEAEEDRVRDEHAALRSSSAEDEAAVRRFRAGGSLLGDRTSALVSALAAEGIDAEPLCSLVEMADERWRDAAETLLGPAREALIVDPSDVSKAIQVMDEAGRRFDGCMVYDAKERDRASPSAARGTLASMLKTSNPFARAFLSIRIGNVQCVEDREDLRAHNRAVTPSVMVKGGGAIQRSTLPRTRLLGLTAQGETAEAIARRIAANAQEMSRLSARSSRLRAVSTGLASFLASSKEAERLGEIEGQLVAAMNRADAARGAAEAVRRMLSSDRFQALRDLEQDRDGHVEDLNEAQEDLKKAASASGQAHERASRAAADLASVRNRLQEVSSTTPEDVRAEASELVDRLVNSRGGARDVAVEARTKVKESGGRIEQRLDAFRQETANYARDSGIEFNAGETFDELAWWIDRRMRSLEGDVLANYEKEAAHARSEMEKAIYDDFILNLANDLSLGRDRVKYLNKALGDHVFNGERFAFTVDEHPDYADVVALSRAVLSSERRISDLFETNPERSEDLSDREERGLRKIRAIFEGGGDVDHFTDYRNYLTFDLVSYNADSGARLAGARERSKRSGGERQVPFYVAMASAMASVCFRGRRRGMGLAMFDEAFNALDNANISSSLAMMRQLGLQFLLSAPTEKASAFVPHVDTVINVSRHDAFCQIDVEYPKERARREMLERDPSISGIAALRRDAA